MTDGMTGGMTAGMTGEGFPEIALEKQDLTLKTGAMVTAAVAVQDAVAAGFGDGTLRFFHPGKPPVAVDAHGGAVLCLAADGDHALTGGDDGRCLRISPEGAVEELASFGTRWVDCVAAGPGFRACSSGRVALVWSEGATNPVELDHPSTVGGLAFDAKGKRLAVAHYGGATIWERGPRRWKASKLFWNGYHAAITFSPDGKFVVTAMQETMLHGWRLRDKADLQMSGYPMKVKSFAWVGDAPYLATSGAYDAICWPFDGKDGPMGRKPVRVARAGQLATVVHAVPGRPAVLAGFKEGVVMLSDLDDAKPPTFLQTSNGIEVTALAVTDTLSHLLIGHEEGTVRWTPLRPGA